MSFSARTTRVTALGRGFGVDNDPSVPVEAIRNGVRLSRYVRMRKILEDAVVVGKPTARTVSFSPVPRRLSPTTRARNTSVRRAAAMGSTSTGPATIA